jgi:hypothetical protein
MDQSEGSRRKGLIAVGVVVDVAVAEEKEENVRRRG